MRGQKKKVPKIETCKPKECKKNERWELGLQWLEKTVLVSKKRVGHSAQAVKGNRHQARHR